MEELLFLDGRKDHNMASIVLKNPAGLSPVAFAFEIFRDRVGHWCARRTDGKVGGTFLERDGALRFARRECWNSSKLVLIDGNS
jgi:hypothetical protein